MKLNRILFTTAILSAVAVQSQTTPKKNQLEFSVGNDFGFLKNLEFAPVRMYEYEGLVYKLGYTRTSKKQNLFEVKLDYLKAELKTDVLSNLNTDYSKIGVGFSYLKQVYNKNQFAVHVGLQSQTNTSTYLNGDYSPTHDENYFTFHQEFGIKGRFSYQIDDRQYLASKLTLPVVLLRLTNAEGKLYSLDTYQSVVWDLEYGYKLSNHFDVKANYNFNYSRLQVLSSYRELQHQLNLGINYKF
ncbi:hypothetical protein C8C83_3635 [Flavobacterium sp. 90]|uniref:hypothetical protein n=1 Tax=unclassified Flavobacterium TaxID=196869 RepID=UPI000EB4F53D|nr:MULTISPECIES: hypothetical protein [unclassified Flavobacterium]RKR11879.1 hypothetical protein C8C82_3954 [Flavobacterium sp. 81]TCK55653.1 hypothetical protein C8C83_3635 [Flavobacterium sp. 90]